MLHPAEIDEVVQDIVARLRPERVLVFGSYAKGTASDDSDLDLLVVADTPLPPAHRTDGLPRYVESMLVRIDILVHTPEEVDELSRDRFSLVTSALRSGRVVYEA